jgi:Uma2 family endonuclease
MSPADPAKPLATADDLLALGDDARVELVAGEIVQKLITFKHGIAQLGLGDALGGFRGKAGRRGPGGWWIGSEIDMQYERHELYRHDLAGWRRERVPEIPEERPVTIVPDWACEILSASNASNDTVVKMRVLHRHEVRRYWILDPLEASLLVYRWAPGGYSLIATAMAGETVRAEAFDAIELSLDDVLGRA